MKQTNAFIISLLIGGVSIPMAALIIYAFGLPFVMTFIAAISIILVMTVLIYFILQYFVFSKIIVLNDELESNIKKKRIISVNGESIINNDPIFEIGRSVKRLLKEATNEIDNLKKLEEYRKEFLGNVAHELRSPIFTVQGYVYTLLEGAIDDPEVNMKFLEKAANQIDHLSSLVEDLVTINMIESGQLHVEYTEFNIKDLVREVIELLDMQARKREIVLSMKSNTDNGLYVSADRQKIRQVLINLINNSIKYGTDGGYTTISLQDMHQFVSIEVSDNGEGIDEEHLPRIFERFYRIDKSRARAKVSTGLGLSIVKHFLEAHKQKIIASSILGVGSIFSFTLEKQHH